VDAEDFVESAGGLAGAAAVRERLLKDGWMDVS
jgi:hypothetical protein